MNRNRSRAQRIRRAREAMLPIAIEALKTPALDQAVRWYSDKCGDITYRMMKVSGMNEWQCCVILAALSANTAWDVNVRRAIQAAEYIGGRDVPFPGGTKYHVDNILWAGANPKYDTARMLTGRKTRNFAKAIYGDESAVTVDLWMCLAANITKRDGSPVKRPTDAQYDIVEAAIDQVAQKIGLSPRDTQALIWIHVRGSAD